MFITQHNHCTKDHGTKWMIKIVYEAKKKEEKKSINTVICLTVTVDKQGILMTIIGNALQLN